MKGKEKTFFWGTKAGKNPVHLAVGCVDSTVTVSFSGRLTTGDCSQLDASLELGGMQGFYLGF